jgi:hypothetical protein
MKAQFITRKLIAGTTAICAMAIAANAAAKNPKEVELNIIDDQLVIITKKDANDCPWQLGQFRNNGCIKVLKNKKSKIYFHLKGDTRCGLESGTSWELDAVYLGGFNSGSKPGSFGFASLPDTDFNKVKSDFNIADANRASGMVTTIEKSAKKIAINDENQYQYDVWYKIEAICKREDGNPPHTTSSDPRVKNGGTE